VALRILSPVAALTLSLAIGGLFILLIGADPLLIYSRLLSETFGTWYGTGQVFFKTTTFLFTGLSAAIAFRSGLFNIGAEGQLTVGAFAMAFAGFTFTGLHPVVHILLCLCAGFLAGAAWGVIPGFLKARYGAHEVITTIMMNFIAAALVSYCVNDLFGVAATIHTNQIAESAWLPRLEQVFHQFRGSPVNGSLAVGVVTCLLSYHLISKTRLGYELRTTGLSKGAAEYAGINVSSRIVIAMALAGGIAGIGGSNFVLGYKHYYEIGFSDGAGFTGIAVALLGRNHPVGIVITAMFLGTLEYGGLAINSLVPKELVNILQAIIILSTIIVTKVIDRFASSRRAGIQQENAYA
jgi:simple sugar transport system permease protein